MASRQMLSSEEGLSNKENVPNVESCTYNERRGNAFFRNSVSYKRFCLFKLNGKLSSNQEATSLLTANKNMEFVINSPAAADSLSDGKEEKNEAKNSQSAPDEDLPSVKPKLFTSQHRPKHSTNGQRFHRNSASGSSAQRKWGSRGDGILIKRDLDQSEQELDSSAHLKKGKTSHSHSSSLHLEELRKLCLSDPDEIVCKLLDKYSGLKHLLKNSTIDFKTMNQFMKILAKAASSCTFKASSCSLFNQIFGSSIFKKLIDMYDEMIESPDDASEFFQNQFVVMEKFYDLMPASAIDKIPNLIKVSLLVMCQLSSKFDSIKVISEQYDSLMASITSNIASRKVPRPQKSYLAKLDNVEPDENFRDMSIEPTEEDLDPNLKPFLRRNITNGSYKDIYTYLDVQFRLMREDFIQYIREGINEMKNDSNARPRNVFVYNNVTFVQSQMNLCSITHVLQLDPLKKVNLKSRKRLMNGNLLCITADNFKTLLWATISFKNEDDLLEKKFGVEMLSGAKLEKDVHYTVLESGAFFVAYSHVLAALQNLQEEDLPFAEHIVFVMQKILPPVYLGPDSVYDLNPFKKMSLKDKSDSEHDCSRTSEEMPNDDASSTSEEMSEHDGSNTSDDVHQLVDEKLTNVTVCSDLPSWPSASDLGLDESQLKAVHSALTNKIALIQGPPGTGKTFIGLKITEVLLKNKHIWNSDRWRNCPIVVVCYTNHALDQFLEGILSFNKNLVRIGTRCKNEKVEKYQIAEVLNKMEQSRAIPDDLFHKLKNEKDEVKYQRDSYNCIQYFLSMIHEGKGIVSLDVLYREEIISETVYENLNKRFLDWILPMEEHESVNCNEVLVEETKLKEVTSANCIASSDWKAIKHLRERDGDNRFSDHHYRDHDDVHSLGYDDETGGGQRFIKQDSFIRSESYYQTQLMTAGKENRKKSTSIVAEFRCFKKVVNFNSLDEDQSYYSLQRDLFKLKFVNRCNVYASWIKKLEFRLSEELREIECRFVEASSKLAESKVGKKLYATKRADVIGLTTTGAASCQTLLEDLKPKIVIIEEAAEILEAHVLATLPSTCEHLIMIGDHQQLRPSPAVHKLAKKYSMETSMFERLIKNNLPYSTLQFQHRMRPEISKLIVPSIYENLENAPSVHQLPPILGTTRSLFFMNHPHLENLAEDEEKSHSNPFEAEMVVQLAKYFVLQGYTAQQITILTPYSGQFFLISDKCRNVRECSEIRVSIVDNFQGEENDLIILSLVRSNDKLDIGFLKEENRICVSLSRAKQGLFIVGNLDQMCLSSSLWKKIRTSLEEMDSVDTGFKICCQNHPEVLRKLSSAAELQEEAPEGGCTKPCHFPLQFCDHPCPRLCHPIDIQHRHYNCPKPCERLCIRGHPCPLLCYMTCSCKVLIQKTFDCGHSHELPCHDEACPTMVMKTFPRCSHQVLLQCSVDLETVPCNMACGQTAPCGHKCLALCHMVKDPDHEKTECREPCQKKCVNGHHCTKICSEPCPPCETKVQKCLPCGHTQLVPCSTEPEDFLCPVKVKKELEPCHHTQEIECYKNSESKHCTVICGKPRECGHLCAVTCGSSYSKYKLFRDDHSKHLRVLCTEPCTKINKDCVKNHQCKLKCYQKCQPCQEEKVLKIIPGCFHTKMIDCGVKAERFMCLEPCSKKMRCGHACTEPCGAKNCLSCLDCQVPVLSHNRCSLNHKTNVPCKLSSSLNTRGLDGLCSAPCGASLPCGHHCLGSCSKCSQGNVHEPCQQKCSRMLICGHLCGATCSTPCPPCQKEITLDCPHGSTVSSCSRIQTSCKKECEGFCKHSRRCKGECGRPCSCHPCSKPCSKKLPCQHPCQGFCGDACPPLCPLCDGKQFKAEVFGYQKSGQRLIYLPDCGHCIEAKTLESHLTAARDGVLQAKCCPRCSSPIFSSKRFKNLVWNHRQMVQLAAKKMQEPLRNNYGVVTIHSIVAKTLVDELTIYGKERRFYPRYPRKMFNKKLLFLPNHKAIPLCLHVDNFIRLNNRGHRDLPYYPNIQLEVLHFQAHFLLAAANIREALALSAGNPADEISEQRRQSLDNLVKNVLVQEGSLSTQFKNESILELKKLVALMSVDKLSFTYSSDSSCKDIIELFRDKLHPSVRFNEEAFTAIKRGLDMTSQKMGLRFYEFPEIPLVRATSMNVGSWNACPNKHVYHVSSARTSYCRECVTWRSRNASSQNHNNWRSGSSNSNHRK